MTTYRDRVRETTETTGTGDLTMLGAVAGYQSFFDAFGAVSGVPYAIEDGTDWEVGTGTVVDADTFSRDDVEASSNAGALVNWPAGEKQVFHGLLTRDAEAIGLIEVSDDAGASSDPARMLVVGSGLSLSLVGDEATIEVLDSGTGPSGGSLVSGYEILVEADDVGGASNGSGVTTWPDQSANGYDFTEATNPPTYRSADADDGLPYVEFDGSNDLLQAIRTAGLVAQTDMTLYWVARWTIQASTLTAWSMSQAGEGAGSGIRPFWQVGTAGFPTLTYDSLAYTFAGVNDHRRFSDWQVGCFRTDIKMGRGTLLYTLGGLSQINDKGAASLPTLDFDRIRLGAQYGNFGNASQWCRVDYRAFALYLSAHTDPQVRSMMGYLRDKWSADLMKLLP